jgi:hypothetical protein
MGERVMQRWPSLIWANPCALRLANLAPLPLPASRAPTSCGVVGNCVGGGNHRFFAGFLVMSQMGCAILGGGAVWGLRHRGFPGRCVFFGCMGGPCTFGLAAR